MLLLLAMLACATAVADRAWTRASGVVAGELTSVSPIVQARLQKLFVNCLDHVQPGQRLAEFDNEATVEAASQQLQQLELLLKQARAEAGIAKSEAAAARQLVEAQGALLQQTEAVLAAQTELAKKQFVATLVWQNAESSVVRAAADKAAAQFLFESKLAEQSKADVAANVLAERIVSFRNSAELTGHFFLTAPKAGIVTECSAHVGEVVAAKTPILQIFNPDDAYAIAFFDPSDITRLHMGQRIGVQISGVSGAMAGQVSGFYPELSALPSSLTRYFWQQERWSQYAPVRVSLSGLTPEQSAHLGAWAQLSVSFWQWPTGWADYYRGWSDATRQWVQQHVPHFGPIIAESHASGR